MPTGPLASVLAIAIALCTATGAAAIAAVPAVPPPAAAARVAPVADPSAAAPLISATQLANIEKFVDKRGRKAVLDPDTSQGLKLGKDDAPVLADQVSLVDKADPKGRHLLYRLSDGSGYLLQRQKSDLRALYYLSKDLKVIEGVRVQPGRREPLSAAQTRKELRDELLTWAGVARQDQGGK